jgi:hypothetical protein
VISNFANGTRSTPEASASAASTSKNPLPLVQPMVAAYRLVFFLKKMEGTHD